MKKTIGLKGMVIGFVILLLGGCGSLDLSKLQQQVVPGQSVTAAWQNPANYARTPTGTNPVNPITLVADFSDETGCPYQLYRFWLFSRDGGTPLNGIGTAQKRNTLTNHFEQLVTLPVDVPVYQIKLSCVQPNGQRYSDSAVLESGTPAFTPRYAIAWQNPDSYSRTPSGTQPTNPITLSVNFSDETGCPYQLYRFWQYSLNGSPVGPIGEITTLVQGVGVSTTVTLPTSVPVYAVRLACVDEGGNLYEESSNLEVGNPAFIPINTNIGGCSEQNTAFCSAPETESACTDCGGSWESIPSTTTIGCSGSPYEGGCDSQTTESTCLQMNSSSSYLDQPLCIWNGTVCQSNTNVCTIQTSATNCLYANTNGFGNCTWGSIPPRPGTCIGDPTENGEAQCEAQTTESACLTYYRDVLSCYWDGSSCHVKPTICTDQTTQAQCIELSPDYYNLGSCTWNTPGTCSGDLTASCQQNNCDMNGIDSQFGNVGQVCNQNTSNMPTSCQVTKNCNSFSESQCNAIHNSGNSDWSVCTWIPADTYCNNPNATLCANPQTSAQCTICGGTWTE